MGATPCNVACDSCIREMGSAAWAWLKVKLSPGNVEMERYAYLILVRDDGQMHDVIPQMWDDGARQVWDDNGPESAQG